MNEMKKKRTEERGKKKCITRKIAAWFRFLNIKHVPFDRELIIDGLNIDAFG